MYSVASDVTAKQMLDNPAYGAQGQEMTGSVIKMVPVAVSMTAAHHYSSVGPAYEPVSAAKTKGESTEEIYTYADSATVQPALHKVPVSGGSQTLDIH